MVTFPSVQNGMILLLFDLVSSGLANRRENWNCREMWFNWCLQKSELKSCMWKISARITLVGRNGIYGVLNYLPSLSELQSHEPQFRVEAKSIIVLVHSMNQTPTRVFAATDLCCHNSLTISHVDCELTEVLAFVFRCPRTASILHAEMPLLPKGKLHACIAHAQTYERERFAS